MVCNLVEFGHIWEFVLRALSSTDVPILLLNQPIDKSDMNLQPHSNITYRHN